MKKFYAYFMAALVAVFVLAACGTEPNEPVNPNTPGNDTTEIPGGNDTIPGGNDTIVNPGDENLLLGNWIVDSSFIQVMGMTQDLEMTGTIFTINEDGTLTMSQDGESDSFTYTVEDNYLYITIVEDGESTTQQFTILTLTETSLVLTAQETEQGMTAELFIYLSRTNG